MLEKNKDYVEFTLQCTSVDWARNKNHPEVCLNGYSNFDFPGVPIMDVVCKEFNHKVVVVGKRDFERLQAASDINAAIAKEWEKNYNLLLEKTGFDTVEELVFYLTNVTRCVTLQEAIANLQDKYQNALDKCEECEKDYISERDKAEALETENEELKKKLNGFDPMPESKDLLKKLYTTEDVEKLEWTLNHICGGMCSANGWRAISLFWKQKYKALSKIVGFSFSSVEEIEDYLVNEAECDTLQEAISSLKDQVKYTCDEWYSANSRNNSWKAAAECNSPKELIEKIEELRGKVKVLETEAEVYSRALQEWKEVTGYPSPSAVKTLIESGASWHHAYNESRKANEKRADTIKSWQKATGFNSPLEANIGIRDYKDTIQKWKDATKCETPEAAATWITSYESACARGNGLAEEVEEWKKATGCGTPEAAKYKTNDLINEATAWNDDYNHLLALTGFDNEGEIEDFLEQNHDRNKLTTVIDNIKLENESMKAALRISNSVMQKELDQEIDKWQTATGCETPEEAETTLRNLHRKIVEMKEFATNASNWIDRIEED